MRLSDLKPGQFFEFRAYGYCFRRCLYVGFDEYGLVNFVHQTAALERFLLNSVPRENNPEVDAEVPQDWSLGEYNYGPKT
jgi:hypothetical protein